MPIYFVNDNPQSDGFHEVHESDCSWLALAKSKTRLGYFSNCYKAVSEAKEIYTQSDGCKHCCPDCHNI